MGRGKKGKKKEQRRRGEEKRKKKEAKERKENREGKERKGRKKERRKRKKKRKGKKKSERERKENEQLKGWVDAMKEELIQFHRNKVWTLATALRGKSVIGSKWEFKNKMDKHGTIIRNKARLVSHSYSREEGINYDETLAPVARMEAIRIFLFYATYKNFKVYQMDVKSVFLNGKHKEEAYVKQPLGFESSEFPYYVCELDKALLYD
ncbi:retrovirus-related pol polyprotein from transposon TNT 1-94 [Tanacetum coccineum]